MSSKQQQLLTAIKKAAVNLGSPPNYEAIMQSIGDARVVMIGEASHGTHEFYHHRAEITKKLITEKGFDFVCVEGDWPDAYQINRYVKSRGVTATEAFSGFQRFPTWMWKNTVVAEFTHWLHEHNKSLDDLSKVGFYGLDIYSLHQSAQAVIEYLGKVDPDAASRARSRYACFDQYGDDPQSYGMAAAFGLSPSCEQGAISMLMEMQKRLAEKMNGEGFAVIDREFYAFVNATVVRDADEYYRGMFLRKNTWNIRDSHMERTLEQLMEHIDDVRRREGGGGVVQAGGSVGGGVGESGVGGGGVGVGGDGGVGGGGKPVKAVVWAHNSHLGDARYTEFAQRGEQNVGQLVRQRFGKEATYNVGFTTFSGTVTAADEWDDPPQKMQVRPAADNTYEKLFHDVGGNFTLRFRANKTAAQPLSNDESGIVKYLSTMRSMLERAIGVIYRPKTERQSHLFEAQIAEQFDSVIHVDNTSALQAVDDEYLSRYD